MKTANLTQKLNFYELIGIILGDGCIYNYPDKRVYGLEIVGNADDDNEYFLKISKFIQDFYGKKPRIYVKPEKSGKSLRLMVYSKAISNHLINDIVTNSLKQNSVIMVINRNCSAWFAGRIF